MRIESKTKNRKLFIVLIVVVLILGGAGLAVFIYAKNKAPSQDQSTVADRPANSIDYGPPTSAEVKEAQRQKEERVQQIEDNKNQEDSSIVVSIVRADQAEPGQPLNIRANISGVGQGSCEVTLTKDGAAPLTRSFEVLFEATQSRCVGADILASAFSAAGEWDLTLVVKSGDRQSQPVTQKVEIKK